MVVLQLGPYPPPHGGVQSNLVTIRRHLRSRKLRAPVINLTRHRRADADDVYYPGSALQVLKLLLSIPADVIHLHIGGRLSARLLALCLFCSLLPGRRTVLTFHSGGYPSWQKPGRLRRWSLRGFILRRLDVLIAVNAEIARVFRALGVDPERIRIICPYLPVSVRADLRVPDILARFIESHRPLLTTVGGLEPEYDIPLQIEALGIVRRTHPDAGLVIIGSGAIESDIRGLIARQPYADHILLCGDVPHAQTLHTMARSDAFLRTTHYDGDSISVREALQLRIPVVATDNGMRPGGVHLLSRSDPQAVAEMILSVVHGRAGSTAASTPADPGGSPRELDELMAIYSSLVDRARPVRCSAAGYPHAGD